MKIENFLYANWKTENTGRVLTLLWIHGRGNDVFLSWSASNINISAIFKYVAPSIRAALKSLHLVGKWGMAESDKVKNYSHFSYAKSELCTVNVYNPF